MLLVLYRIAHVIWPIELTEWIDRVFVLDLLLSGRKIVSIMVKMKNVLHTQLKTLCGVCFYPVFSWFVQVVGIGLFVLWPFTFNFIVLTWYLCPLPQEENLEYFDRTPTVPKFYGSLCDIGNGRFLSFYPSIPYVWLHSQELDESYWLVHFTTSWSGLCLTQIWM